MVNLNVHTLQPNRQVTKTDGNYVKAWWTTLIFKVYFLKRYFHLRSMFCLVFHEIVLIILEARVCRQLPKTRHTLQRPFRCAKNLL